MLMGFNHFALLDDRGNLVGLDSVKTWHLSGKEISQREFDSMWKEIGLTPDMVFPRNIDPLGSCGLLPGPPLHRFWCWNPEDSTAWSYLYEVAWARSDPGYRMEHLRRDQ